MKFRKTLTFLILAVGVVSVLSLWAQGKPFTQEQVGNMVRDGLGDDAGARLIDQRGIDFAPGEDFLQGLKAAGASDAFLTALRAAKPSQPASHPQPSQPANPPQPSPSPSAPPLNQVQILALLAGGVPDQRVAILVTGRGVDFDITDEYVQEVRRAGGDDGLIAGLKAAKVTRSLTPADAMALARQADVRKHMARGGELARNAQYAQAEQEYRAALALDPKNADLYVGLTYVLVPQQKWDDTLSAGREAIRLDPKNDMAHNNLGVALGSKGDLNGAIAEFHQALVLKPDSSQAHTNLGAALAIKGDLKGAIAEYREALRIDPNYDVAHFNLAGALERKGDKKEALEEYQAASALKPNDAGYKQNYDRMLKKVKK